MDNNLPEGFKKLSEIKATQVVMKDSSGKDLITFTGVDLNIDMNLMGVDTEEKLDYYAFQVAQGIKSWAKGRLAELIEQMKAEDNNNKEE